MSEYIKPELKVYRIKPNLLQNPEWGGIVTSPTGSGDVVEEGEYFAAQMYVIMDDDYEDEDW